MPVLAPPSLLLSVWLESAHLGRVDPADVAARVRGDAPNSLVVMPGGDVHPLEDVVASWTAEGIRATLALPTPGDLVGLAGPAGFNEAATEAGEAVVLPTLALGLVPGEDARTQVWRGYVATPPPYVEPAEAGRLLRQALLEATGRLQDLDVARWQPEIPDILLNLQHGSGVPLPRHWDPRRTDTVHRGLLCREVVSLALDEHGGAVSAYEMEQRRKALRDLDVASRRALVGACSDSLGLR